MSIQTAVLKPDTQLQTRQITPELINYIIRKITNEISPRQIILFGSYARGQSTEISDLDLFIVHDGLASNREVRRRVEYLLWGRYFDLDLIVRTPTEVARNLADGNPFYTQHIFGEGKVLYDRPA